MWSLAKWSTLIWLDSAVGRGITEIFKNAKSWPKYVWNCILWAFLHSVWEICDPCRRSVWDWLEHSQVIRVSGYRCWTDKHQHVIYFIIWLAPRAGKMNQIAQCDWLPEWARWSHLACSRLPAVSCKKNFPKSHIINPLLTKFVRWIWLDIGLVRSSWSKNMQKNNSAYIQRSWPHTWSITRI